VRGGGGEEEERKREGGHVNNMNCNIDFIEAKNKNKQ